MSEPQTIVFDVDGVLANFAKGFTQLRHDLYDRNQPVVYDNDYETWDELSPGASDSNMKTWKAIWRSSEFWRNLHILAGLEDFSRIAKLSDKHYVYFATNRGVTDVKRQTEDWLMFYGIENPTVVITKYKGEFCKTVDARLVIDDKADNASAIAWLSSRTIPYLLDAPYNHYDHNKIGSNKVIRVSNLGQFLDQCEQL